MKRSRQVASFGRGGVLDTARGFMLFIRQQRGSERPAGFPKFFSLGSIQRLDTIFNESLCVCVVFVRVHARAQ